MAVRKFVFFGKPIPKGRPKFRRMGKYTSTYTPKTTVDYENKIRTAYMQQNENMPPLEGGVISNIEIVIPMPASWSKKKKAEMDQTFHIQKPDKDNLEKSILDALNGVAYVDDGQIHTGLTTKIWGYDGEVRVYLTTEEN